jgi:integrase
VVHGVATKRLPERLPETKAMTTTMTNDRRTYGTGSVHFDPTDELWVGTVDLGVVNGRRKRVWRKAKTKAALEAKLRKVHQDKDDGRPTVDQRKTTGAWLDFWLTKVLPGTVSKGTEDYYGQVVRDWVAPYVGSVPLAKLTPEHVIDMVRALEAKGLSPTTQKKARGALIRALNVALRYGRVTRNVAALTDPPKARASKQDDTLDVADAEAVLEAAKGDRLEALAVLVLTLGPRQGEILDLRWSNVNLDNAELDVHGTKSEASDRTVALPPFVVAVLRRHRAAQREERMAASRWDDPDLVFTTTVGTRIHRRNALRWWHELTTRAGVGRRRFHASRHTAATLMLNNGVSLEVVSKTLGHAGLAITADVYAKVRPKLQRTAADAMEDVLGGSK